jgi:hypothetical protein
MIMKSASHWNSKQPRGMRMSIRNGLSMPVLKSKISQPGMTLSYLSS